MPDDSLSPAPPSRSLVAATVLALIVAAGLMFLPLVLIGLALASPNSVGGMQSGELTVGIAVVVRATARRLLRSGMQNLLRTTLGAYTRTAARTVTRRITRLVMRQTTGLLLASALREAAPQEERPATPRDAAVALALGFATLWASFYGILLLIGSARSAPLLAGLSPALAAVLVAAPLLVHALVTTLAARATGVGVIFRTQLDGLLLQGYFTGAGSFLPLATDVAYRGDDAAKARTATIALLGLLGVHLALAAVGRGLGLYPFTFAGAAVLMYCFVFSFPLPPLEGHYLWRRSKLLWLAVWLPTLVAFLANMPEAFAEIL